MLAKDLIIRAILVLALIAPQVGASQEPSKDATIAYIASFIEANHPIFTIYGGKGQELRQKFFQYRDFRSRDCMLSYTRNLIDYDFVNGTKNESAQEISVDFSKVGAVTVLIFPDVSFKRASLAIEEAGASRTILELDYSESWPETQPFKAFKHLRDLCGPAQTPRPNSPIFK